MVTIKKIASKLIRDEQGYALIVVLVLTLVGGLLISPLLYYTGTGIKAGQEVYEEGMYLLYGADSGVEHALWTIENDGLPAWMDTTWDDAVFDHDPYTYSTSPINDNSINVEIQNIQKYFIFFESQNL